MALTACAGGLAFAGRAEGTRVTAARVAEIVFRRATLADRTAIVELIESAYRGDESRRGWTTEADLLEGQRTDALEIADIVNDPNGRLTLALDGEAVVGTVLVKLEDGVAHVGMLAVRPALQRGGLGRRLLLEAEHIARDELGCDRAAMHVIESRRELVAWYEARGYRDTGVREAFPYDNPRYGVPKVPWLRFIVMEKALR
jgi:ribosomal protein S18 acetylase RimI-like enzyme